MRHISCYRLGLWLSFILLLNLTPCSSNAQDVTYSLQHISLEEGLSQSTIRDIHRDRMGRLWLGTKNGLNRFDGFEMRNYFQRSDPASGLPDNYIYFVTEDSNHTIWLGTKRGVVQYDSDHDAFRPPFNASNNRSVTYSNVLAMGDTLIFGSTNHLAFYDVQHQHMTTLDFNGEPGAIPLLYKMVPWKDQHLVIASRWKGLFLCDLNTGNLRKAPFVDADEIVTIYRDRQCHLWISVYKKGLFVFDSERQLIHRYHTSNSALRSDIVLALCEVDDEIWIGTDGGGLQRLDPKSELFQDVPLGSMKDPALNSISEIYCDEFSNVWLGTINGGAFFLRKVLATSYSDVSWGNPNGLSSQTVLSLFAASDQDLWIGTDGGGINRYNLQAGTFQHYPATHQKKVNAIAPFSEDALLVNCFTEGLKVFDTHSGELSEYALQISGGAHVPGQGVLGISLMKVTAKEVLVVDDVLQVIDISTGVLKLVPTPQLLPAEGELKLACHHLEDLYLYGQRGIYRYTIKNRNLKLVYKVSNDELIKSACVETDESVWLSTSRSFYHITDHYQTVKTIDPGLPGTVTSIASGGEKQLWLGIGRSLVMLDKNTGNIYRMGRSEGIISNEYYAKPVTSTKSHVFMGGATGLVDIRKGQFFKEQKPLALFVTDIKQNGQPISSDLLDAYNKDQTIALPWNYGLLQFNLVIKETDLFKEKSIKYKIQGYSDQFVETNDRRISIIGLTPGSYAIQLKVIGEAGLWTPAHTVMKVSVLPPWWQTQWFKMVSVLISIMLVLLVWYVLYNRHRVKMTLEMQEKDRRLNDQKITFLTNISHEIRTPLSLMYGPLELLIKENKQHLKEFDLLQLVFKQVKYLKVLVEQTLNFERIDKDAEELNYSEVNLNAWLKEIIEGFDFELKKSGIQVIYDLDQSVEKVRLDKRAMIKVIYNLIINIIKHAPETKNMTVSTQNRNNHFVRVAFTDEGGGVPAGTEEKLFNRYYQLKNNGQGYGIGLAYAKLLVERQGGEIGVENADPQGARFFFELPLEKEQAIIVNHRREAVNSQDRALITSSQKEEVLSQLTLLVVEDNVELSGYIKQLFKNLLKRVDVAFNGEEGLRKAVSEMPDIVLSDVMMPVMDGNELCRRVKSNIEISHIPVILLTARQDEASFKQGYKMGADGYLTKPFSNDVLINIVYNMMLSRMRLKENYKSALHQASTVAKITTSNADEQFLKKINQIIKEELNNPDLNVDLLVDKMAISRATLYTKFKAVLGVGINTYINDYRIAEARILLEQTNYPMVEISEMVGFQSQSYFSTLFKQQQGISPMKYRQNSKK